MQDDLQKAYAAYQQALYLLPNPKVTSIQLPYVLCTLTPSTKEDPKLWYGIGILYDRYGALDHAEEAFSSSRQQHEGMPLTFSVGMHLTA